MRVFLLAVALAATFANPDTADAQEDSPWGWEVRFGIDLPTDEFGEADLDTGLGIEGKITYQFRQDLSGYFGWGWDRFEADNALLSEDTDVEETGYNFGVELKRPIKNSSFEYFAQVGGIYNHIEIETGDGSIVADSGHGLGWQLGAGLAFSVGDAWRLRPGVRYQSLSRDITVEGADLDVDLRYFELGIGFSRSF